MKCRLEDYERSSSRTNEYLSKFESFSAKFNFFISHTGLKNFFYFIEIQPYIEELQRDPEAPLRILEIGAGFFTFGYILSRHLPSFEYVVVDLPEMIAAATSHFLDMPHRDFEIFFPNQIEDFKSSSATRKVLFLAPADLKAYESSFDLFVNFESFAEMDIATVNDYLDQVEILLRPGGILFTVNRHSRAQALSRAQFEALSSLEQITSFNDYRLDFCEPVVKKLCPFRQSVPKDNDKPNVFFIGRRRSL